MKLGSNYLPRYGTVMIKMIFIQVIDITVNAVIEPLQLQRKVQP
jgi:hypothetical protein